ncbi:hypothetical protein MRX96_026165 [Rhipicephalus microplus]
MALLSRLGSQGLMVKKLARFFDYRVHRKAVERKEEEERVSDRRPAVIKELPPPPPPSRALSQFIFVLAYATLSLVRPPEFEPAPGRVERRKARVSVRPSCEAAIHSGLRSFPNRARQRRRNKERRFDGPLLCCRGARHCFRARCLDRAVPRAGLFELSFFPRSALKRPCARFYPEQQRTHAGTFSCGPSLLESAAGVEIKQFVCVTENKTYVVTPLHSKQGLLQERQLLSSLKCRVE